MLSRGHRLALFAALALAALATPSRAEDGGTPDSGSTRRRRSSAKADAAAPAPADAPVDAPAANNAPDKAEAKSGDKAKADVDTRSFVFPSGGYAELLDRWSKRRQYLKDHDNKRVEEQEREIVRLKEELGFENLFAVGAALVREADSSSAGRSPQEALRVCRLAVELAPALPAAHLCVARTTFALDGTKLGDVSNELVQAMSATFGDPRSRRVFLGDTLWVACIGLFAAGVAFILLMFARSADLYLHDVNHLFPRGATYLQTSLLALLALALPFVMQAGPLLVVGLLLLASILYTSRVEAGIAAAGVALLALVPLAATTAARVSAFGGVVQDVYQLEYAEVTPVALARLQARVDGQNAEFATVFALARGYKRIGEIQKANDLYKKAVDMQSASAEAHNNYANTLLLLGDSSGADREYAAAENVNIDLLEAHYNRGRLSERQGTTGLQNAQDELKFVRDRDITLVEKHELPAGATVFPANRFLADARLPESELDKLVAVEGDHVTPMSGEIQARLAGAIPKAAAPIAPVLFAILALALRALKSRIIPSNHCERCGRAVCWRCEPGIPVDQGLCGQCVSVFVRRTGVDAAERIRKEIQVRRHRRRRGLAVRGSGLLVSGAGHVIAGYPVRGILFLLGTGLLLAQVVFWNGFVKSPFAVRAGASTFKLGALGTAMVLLYALSFWDLLVRERQNE